MSVLDKYIPLVDFMGVVFGSSFEIILHDVSNPEASIIAIKNGHISGRTLGGPMTDLALRMMRDHDYHTKNFIANYEGKTKDGRTVVSSTYYICEDGQLIGMICVNHDVQDLIEADRLIKRLKETFHLAESDTDNPEYSENLDDSIIGYSNNLIHTTLSNLKISPQRMSVSEKVAVIRQLDQQGIFATKGSATQLARYFGTSESTIYRYISRARKNI